jgi:outer membrane protein TolC
MREPWYIVVALAGAGAIATPIVGYAQQTAAPSRQAEHFHVFEARTPDGPPLTLQAALSEALDRNPVLAALRSQLEVARQRPGQERFLMAPTLEAQIWQWPVTAFNPADTNMYMLGIGQQLPGRGKRLLREQLAERGVEIAASDIAVRARDVVAQVKRAYAELFVTRKDIEIHLESVELLRQFSDISHAKYATGRISQQDVVKAVVELSVLHEDLVMMDERARLAEARLNTLLDRAPDAPIGPLAEPRTEVALPAPAVLQQLAIESQPELKQAQLQKARAEAALAVAKSEYRPDFLVGATYMLMPRDGDAWAASFGITWPRAPWSRGRLDARVAETTADLDAARAEERVVENSVRLAVQEAYIRAQAASQRAALLRSSVVPQSLQAIDVARVAYQSDRGDFLALIDNQRALLDAQHSYYMALSALEQAMADLERAVGVDLGEAATPLQAAFEGVLVPTTDGIGEAP